MKILMAITWVIFFPFILITSILGRMFIWLNKGIKQAFYYFLYLCFSAGHSSREKKIDKQLDSWVEQNVLSKNPNWQGTPICTKEYLCSDTSIYDILNKEGIKNKTIRAYVEYMDDKIMHLIDLSGEIDIVMPFAVNLAGKFISLNLTKKDKKLIIKKIDVL